MFTVLANHIIKKWHKTKIGNEISPLVVINCGDGVERACHTLAECFEYQQHFFQRGFRPLVDNQINKHHLVVGFSVFVKAERELGALKDYVAANLSPAVMRWHGKARAMLYYQ